MKAFWIFLRQVLGWFADLIGVLLACRFSTIFTVLGYVFFVAVGQGRESLQALSHDTDNPLYWAHHIFFLAAVVVWFGTTWLTSIALLTRRPYQVGSSSARIKTFEHVLPRTLGLLSICSVSLGSFLMDQTAQGLIYLVIALILYESVSRYDDRLRAVLSQESRLTVPAKLNVLLQRTPSQTALHISFTEITRVLILVIGLTWSLFVGFIIAPIWLPQLIGALAILLFACSAWLVFGNFVLTYLPRLNHAPTLVTVLFIWAVGISGWNDNHRVREAKEGVLSKSHTHTVEEHFDKWINSPDRMRDLNKRYPVIIVASEGGGIRAAYWTATLLAAIQEREPSFARHIYAISGVSGGSLGGVVFDALLSQSLDDEKKFCDVNGRAETSIVQCARNILSEDFLSPTLAALLFPDLVQRFLPWPVDRFDRARVLELSWEEAWKTYAGNNRLAEPFDDLWKNDREYRMPSLFLNGTWVETGKRMITSNLNIDANIFNDTANAFSFIDYSVPLSTAAHMSARFTYVSPAGSLRKRNEKQTTAHVVDGGYFENSGTATALDILAAIYDRSQTMNLDFFVLYVSNDPGEKEAGQDDKGNTEPPLPAAYRRLTELMSPIDALFNSRLARGSYSQSLTKEFVESDEHENGKPRYYHFGLIKEQYAPPLGWFLSLTSRNSIDKQRDELIMHNSELQSLLETLKGQ